MENEDRALDAVSPPRQQGIAWLRWSLLALLASAIVLFYLLGGHEYLNWKYLRDNLDEIKGYVDDNLFVAALIFFAIYVVLAAFSVPAAWTLSLLAGALFGRFLGTGVALSAATVGATLAFLSSRYVLRDWVQSRFGARLEALNRGVEKDGAFYLATLRLVPIVPFFLINLGMGLTPIRTWTFTWVTFISMLPGAFIYVNAGTGLANILNDGSIISFEAFVSLALLAIAPLLLRWIVARLRKDGVDTK